MFLRKCRRKYRLYIRDIVVILKLEFQLKVMTFAKVIVTSHD